MHWVDGLDVSDFRIEGTGTLSGYSVQSVAFDEYDHTAFVTINTGTGNGRLTLHLVDDDSVKARYTDLRLDGPGSSTSAASAELDVLWPTGAGFVTSRTVKVLSENDDGYFHAGGIGPNGWNNNNETWPGSWDGIVEPGYYRFTLPSLAAEEVLSRAHLNFMIYTVDCPRKWSHPFALRVENSLNAPVLTLSSQNPLGGASARPLFPGAVHWNGLSGDALENALNTTPDVAPLLNGLASSLSGSLSSATVQFYLLPYGDLGQCDILVDDFDNGNTLNSLVIGTLLAGNALPLAHAGVDQTVAPSAVVNLDGSASFAVSGAPTYTWTQISGPAVVLSDATASAPSFTAPGFVAELEFELTVSSAAGSLSDRVRVLVRNP